MLKKLLPIVFLIVGLGAGAGAGIFLRPAPEAAADAGDGPSPAASQGAEGKAADGHGAPAGTGEHGAGVQGGGDQGAGHGAEAKGHGGSSGGAGEATDSEAHDFVKLNNQFIIPVLEGGRVSSLVIMSLSLEVSAGGRDKVFALEPKLRDAFLRVMFDHANSGGFDGNFTSGNNMLVLRDALKEAAFKVLGPVLKDVLIIDMVRQDA
ncbi:flagellar basal body-associated FliL family protein [Acidimangrovimonas sediminis]|uniref:flagellar basal body-associated FliL family protein n=1 Tax=Acidimangrovimonas sediminis TaxID=2056283 RepID=UPI000C800875|nr:flagellar basal body-associated FliL family protein [Acidimangrovimonas sediminis]